ncbi:MAG TPA: ATP-binding protein [Mucilaginibacter sp.]|nr:ATP-binding protein [Mucilaginibacter sp.]
MPCFIKILWTWFPAFFLSLALGANGQDNLLKPVPGSPSSEIYDLLVDSKGFLWVAHNAGISKYDGIRFTNFSNPLQSSLSTTGLVEDKYGRIWFSNFTGQIFYIENGHMTLLNAYKSTDENYFPRIGLLGDQIIATSRKGVFVCDTRTLKCHYEKSRSPLADGTSSLCILGAKALLYGNDKWYIYSPGRGLSAACFKGDNTTKNIKTSSSTLCTLPFHDTAFWFSNPAGTMYKLHVSGDTVRVCGRKTFKSFINTICIQKTGYIINTTSASIKANTNSAPITGYDLSSIVSDHEGRRWYASLQQGLLMDSAYNNRPEYFPVVHLPQKDIIKSIAQAGNFIFLATSAGNLWAYDIAGKRKLLLMSLPETHGGINYIKVLNGHLLWVGASQHTFLYDVNKHTLRWFEPVRSVKQIDTTENAILLATSDGLCAVPRDTTSDFHSWASAFSSRFKGFNELKDSLNHCLIIKKRNRAVCYMRSDKTIWIALKDGLFEINAKGFTRILYKGAPVFTSCLTSYHDELIAGTFTNGVLVIGKNSVTVLNADNGLLSNNVKQVMLFGNDLWVFSGNSVQIFDAPTLKLINKYSLPDIYAMTVTDGLESNGMCYLVSVNGLYGIKQRVREPDSLNVFLNSLIINKKDTGILNNIRLPYTDNNIQISLSTPYLSGAKNIIIKYRLKGVSSDKWNYGQPGERDFHFASLMPGYYRFEAFAIKPQTGLSSRMFTIDFLIKPPWWEVWWFRAIIIIIFLFIIVTIIRDHYNKRLHEQTSRYEKALIAETERQHISREIHDHIGQSLSVIKMNLNIGTPQLVTEAKNLLNDVIYDLRQFTYGLYYGKLLNGNLHEVLTKDIERLNITNEFSATLHASWTNGIVNERDELAIYRIFQEAISNILKHAKANNIIVTLKSNHKFFQLTITDDGLGFNKSDIRRGLGLSNMEKRAQTIGGRLSIKSSPGNGSMIELLIYHIK